MRILCSRILCSGKLFFKLVRQHTLLGQCQFNIFCMERSFLAIQHVARLKGVCSPFYLPTQVTILWLCPELEFCNYEREREFSCALRVQFTVVFNSTCRADTPYIYMYTCIDTPKEPLWHHSLSRAVYTCDCTLFVPNTSHYFHALMALFLVII